MPRPQPWAWRHPGRPAGRARPDPAQPLPVGRVYLRVGEVALARGKRNMREMAQVTGLAYTTVHSLMRHPERSEAISFDVLARLCGYLNSSPGGLLGYGPPGDYAVSDDLDEEYLPPEPAASPSWPV